MPWRKSSIRTDYCIKKVTPVQSGPVHWSSELLSKDYYMHSAESLTVCCNTNLPCVAELGYSSIVKKSWGFLAPRRYILCCNSLGDSASFIQFALSWQQGIRFPWLKLSTCFLVIYFKRQIKHTIILTCRYIKLHCQQSPYRWMDQWNNLPATPKEFFFRWDIKWYTSHFKLNLLIRSKCGTLGSIFFLNFLL